MRHSLHAALVSMLLVAGSIFMAPLAVAQTVVPRNQHPWGRFEIGSWKEVRVVTETLDEKNRVINSSTKQTTTTLVDIDETSYTLHVEVIIEVAGKRYRAEPQIVKRGFNGESDGQKVSLKKVGEGFVTIDGKRIPSEIRQAVINGGKSKRVITVHYSQQVPPYVLKRDTTSTDLNKSATAYQISTNVVALGMPHRVLAEIKPTTHVKTIKQGGNGSVITLEVHCADVPGGVVSHTLKEIRDDGKGVVRRSTLELIDYGVGDDRTSRRNRRRLWRQRGRVPTYSDRKKR